LLACRVNLLEYPVVCFEVKTVFFGGPLEKIVLQVANPEGLDVCLNGTIFLLKKTKNGKAFAGIVCVYSSISLTLLLRIMLSVRRKDVYPKDFYPARAVNEKIDPGPC